MTARPRKAAVTPAPAAKPDFAALLADAKLPERTVPICMRGDLVAEHETADRELQALADKPVTKFAGDGRGELQNRVRDLEGQMLEATYPFRFRALARKDWHAFVAEHPPRPGNEQDAALEANTDTFFDALIRKCLVDPVLDDEAWFRLTESLTDRQYDLLAGAAWGLNRKDVNVPFSQAAWRQNGTSEPG
jgi:hypothetical protein